VYYIGDFAYKCSRQYALGILSRLAGRIHLVRGNHDKTWLDDHVLSSRDYVELSDHGTRLVLMHYPLESWKGSRRGARMLHGHRHTRGVQDHWGRLDVGVDGHDFYPWHLDEVVQHFLGV
jgi:calcineurin-like phosphoesterase family protein